MNRIGRTKLLLYKVVARIWSVYLPATAGLIITFYALKLAFNILKCSD